MIKDNNTKIIGNLRRDTHKEFNLIKAEHFFKSAEETLDFLIKCYKFLNQVDVSHILNSDIKTLEDEKSSLNNI